MQINATDKLSIEELEVISVLRMTKQADSITIKKVNGKIDRFEITEKVETNKRIVEILNDGEFQDVSIQQKNGRVTRIVRTLKKKVKYLQDGTKPQIPD